MSLLGELRYEPVTRRVRASLDGRAGARHHGCRAGLGAAPRGAHVRRAARRRRGLARAVPGPRGARPAAPRCSGRSTSAGTTPPAGPSTSSSATGASRRRPSPRTTPTSAVGSSSSGHRSTGSRRPTRSSATRTTRSSASTCCPATGTSWCASAARCSADTRTRDRAARDPHPGALVRPPRRRRHRPPRRQPVDHDVRLQGPRHLRLARPGCDRGRRPRGRGHRLDLHPPARTRWRRSRGWCASTPSAPTSSSTASPCRARSPRGRRLATRSAPERARPRARPARSSDGGGHGIRVDEVVQVQRTVEHRRSASRAAGRGRSPRRRCRRGRGRPAGAPPSRRGPRAGSGSRRAASARSSARMPASTAGSGTTAAMSSSSHQRVHGGSSPSSSARPARWSSSPSGASVASPCSGGSAAST